MNLLRNILAIIFYIFFFYWGFLKIRNIILVNKTNCKENYKKTKKELKLNKTSKCLFNFIINIIIIVGVYLYLGIIIVIVVVISGITNLETGVSTFTSNLISFAEKYFGLLSYFFYALIYILLIKALYININIYKLLKNRKLVNDKNIVNTKSNENHKKLLPIAIICIAIVFTFIIALKPSINLEDVVQPSMNISLIMTPNWYFFYNNQLIVYDDDGDQLYSTDLNANNKKIIAESENLRFANFFLVFNNEAYYYTEFNRGIKKVNLLNGDITSVVDNEYLYLIPNTLNESKVLVTYQNNYLNKAHVYVAELDLNTGLLDKEKYIKFNGNKPYFYNEDNNKVYYIKRDDSNRGIVNIYEDNEIIYSYSNSTSQNNNDIVFIQDNFIFAIIESKIIKFDIITHSILEEKIFDTDLKYSLISNVRPGGATMLGNEEICMSLCVINNPVFNSDNNIYKFNSKMLTFEKIVDNANGSFVEKYNNYYIFQGVTREGPITTIYNSDNNNYKIFNSANYSVENEYIYMMTFKGDFYHQKYNNLKFKMKKISLDTI